VSGASWGPKLANPCQIGICQPALPTNQIQSNKLPNKSIKHPENLISNKQIQNLGFEITFDIFGTGYDAMEDSWLGSWPPFLTT
jgi:hypothetical protein